MSNQPAPPLVQVGGEIILAGYVFEVAGHTTDKNGNAVEIPGKALRKASKQEIAQQTKRAGNTVGTASKSLQVRVPATDSSPPKPQPRKARQPRAARGDYRRFKPKPPPIVIHEDPPSASVWLLRAVVAVAIAAAIWFWNQGNEQKKWQRIGGAANAVQRR